MKYRIISVGKIREPFYRDGINEYLKRTTPYIGIELLDGLEEKISAKANEKEIAKAIAKEGQKILHLVGEEEILIAGDIKGKKVSSDKLSEYMEEWNMSGNPRVNFVIGSSHGIDAEVKKRADLRVSFSDMTFPHQMAVLILSEQIYRGFKIIKGEPYHK